MSGARHAASGPLLRAPLFLVGSERSGTTLLRLMLDHHPEIAFEKEFDFAVELISESGDLPPLAAYRDWLGTVRGVDYTIDRTLAYPALVDDFLRQKQAASGGKPYIGATVHRRFDRIRHIWPDARYIHLVRDPRDVARSVVQKGWAGNVYQAAEFWTTAERCWDALAPHLADGQAIEIRYEDLVLRTERVLEVVCAFAGVGYSAQMLDYTADAPQYPPPDPALVLQWRTRLPPADVALVELRTGDLLTRRGYAPSGNPLPAIGPVRHELLLTAARLRRLRTRLAMFGPWLVTTDVLGRRLGLRPLARHAQRGINAVEQSLIDQEAAGKRAPSANIAPVAGPPPPARD